LKFKERLKVIFIYITVVLFVASLSAHLSLYAGFNFGMHFPMLWFLLNVSILIGFIPLGVKYLSEHYSDVPQPASTPEPYARGSAQYVGFPNVAELLVGLGMFVILFYPLFNFQYWDSVLYGHPVAIDGRYFMHYYHGGGLRQISAEDFALKSLYQARKVSGHWMAAHLIAFLLLMQDLKRAPTGSFFHRFKNRFN
jgi:hypothetical protein